MDKATLIHTSQRVRPSVSTGLTKQDFALLVSLNVFNEALMNDAVYKFKRYEDSSLSYAGIDRHEGEQMVGGYSTVITVEEYKHQPSN